MNAADDKYAAKVIVLGEYIAHQVKEEQEEMFPKQRKVTLICRKLGSWARAFWSEKKN
jgi:hypothetical protein